MSNRITKYLIPLFILSGLFSGPVLATEISTAELLFNAWADEETLERHRKLKLQMAYEAKLIALEFRGTATAKLSDLDYKQQKNAEIMKSNMGKLVSQLRIYKDREIILTLC